MADQGRMTGVAGALVRGLVLPPQTPWLPLGFHGSLAVGAVAWNLAVERPVWWVLVGLPAGGLLLWTLVEYVLHGAAFHAERHGGVLAFARRMHGEHHDDPRDPAHIFTRLPFSLPPALLFWGLFRLGLGSWRMAALPLAGLLTGFVAYEVIHYGIHRVPRLRRALRPLASHHLYHHYTDPSRCFGVSSPLWDVVFGTGRRRVSASPEGQGRGVTRPAAAP